MSAEAVLELPGQGETPMSRVVHLACTLLGSDMGLVSILGDSELEFRALVGLDPATVPNDVSVTRALVELGPGTLLDIPDALLDKRFKDHPMVTGSPWLRSYAGATISTSSGDPIGSIAIMSSETRPPASPSQLTALKRLAAMAGDIYDQTTAQRAQREQLDKLTLAEEMGGVGHWRFEPANGNVTWSNEAYRIHGVVPDGSPLTITKAAQYYHWEDWSSVEQMVATGAFTGETFRVRIIRPDGANRLAQVSARAETDEGGRVTAVFGVIQDITDRVAEHASLMKSEADYRLLADNMGDVVARLRPSGRIDYISPASNALLGWPPEDIVAGVSRTASATRPGKH